MERAAVTGRGWAETLDMRGATTESVEWIFASPEREKRELERWRRAVGPAHFGLRPALQEAEPRDGRERSATTAGAKTALDRTPPLSKMTVVSWNLHVGGGSVTSLWRRLEQLDLTSGPVVLLLQEAFSSIGVPEWRDRRDKGKSDRRKRVADAKLSNARPTHARQSGRRRKSPKWATRIHELTPDGSRLPITSVAEELGLSLFYVPSMRNGGPDGGPPEDRGNAILANVPLASPCAIELPFERQRRVALTAKITVGSADWTFCSLHLDNRAPWHKLWRTLGEARRRQMDALLEVMGRVTFPDRMILGGDFNTWVRGTKEAAYKIARELLPEPTSTDPKPTHHFELGGWLRHSDHLLFRLPPGCMSHFRRLNQSFGSDHYPLAGVVELPEIYRPT